MLQLALEVESSTPVGELVASYVPGNSGLSFWLCSTGLNKQPPEFIGYRDDFLTSISGTPTVEANREPFATAVWHQVKKGLGAAQSEIDTLVDQLAELSNRRKRLKSVLRPLDRN